MGQYKIEISATGDHGCQRDVKDGGTVYGCRRMDCLDCQAREFVEQLTRTGNFYDGKATLTHWPGQESEVRDNLVTHIRRGSF